MGLYWMTIGWLYAIVILGLTQGFRRNDEHRQLMVAIWANNRGL